MSTPIRLATRASPLARLQTERVAAYLIAAGVAGAVETVVVETVADRRLDVAISSFAGQGAFVTEVERAVLERRADVAVHSAKDLPSSAPPAGLVLAAVPERADVRDALVGSRLDDLAPGALVATGAARRRVQLSWCRPDLGFTELRGNIARRLDKQPAGGAVVVALAALERLGLAGRASEVLETSLMLPQVGQGAIALRCREDDGATRERCASIDDVLAHRCLLAERAFLARIGGGCEAPLGALARLLGDGSVHVEGLIASADGHALLRRSLAGGDAEETGRALAETMLDADGGSALLESGSWT